MAVKFNLPLQDPRSYVKQVTLPVKTQVGVKIQARTESVYNPCEPNRDEIRRRNYNRRLHQLTEEGFQSPIWKPYQGVGDPVYLDDRQLILDTLGLAEKKSPRGAVEQKEKKKDESGDENDDNASSKSPARQGSTVNPSKYMQRRMRRGFINLKSELRHSENIGHYVRIGQSFFDILNKERDEKLDSERLARLREEHRLRTEIQPPRYESSSEEEYEALEEPASRPEPESASSTRISSAVSGFVRRKRRKVNPRPYTPIHCNIGLPTCEAKEGDEPAVQSLFRQLCCLHWFLEAMTVEPPNAMRQISTCWNIKQIGGSRINQKARESMKDANQNWDRFVTQPKVKSWAKRSSVTMPRRAGFWTSRSVSTQRGPAAGSQSVSRASSPSPGLGQGPDEAASNSGADELQEERDTDEVAPTHISLKSYIPVARFVTRLQARSSVTARPCSTASARRQDGFSSDYDLTRSDAQSVVSTASSRRRSKVAAPGAAETGAKAQRFAIPLDLDVSKLTRKKISELSRIVGAELERQPDFYAERREFRSMKIGSQTARPASAPVTSDASKFPSQRWGSMVQDMRLKYDLVAEEKAIDLQDRLEHMQRHRIKVCTDKFLALPTSGAPHRAIREMRSRGRYEASGADSAKRKSSVHSAWYSELMRNLPPRMHAVWFIRAILVKLQHFAVMQSSKHRVLKFTKVLQTLTDWEICSPDVCAAIEFVREKVVDMTVEEFEEWFQESFAHVVRPTLPTIRINIRLDDAETETVNPLISSNPENEETDSTAN